MFCNAVAFFWALACHVHFEWSCCVSATKTSGLQFSKASEDMGGVGGGVGNTGMM